ncbi:MAG: electron transport complex subunit RsxA [Mollicutes bacterium]|nr:electron transport complex subunit RsxA [Mollicutes bacterium]MDY3904588.1 Rnf-Nqr domain containing protein [Candidatus Enteromonas sp.]
MNILVSFLLAILSYSLINNVVLVRFYGICSFVGVGNKIKSAFFMGLAVSFVIILATLICYPIYYYVLVPAGIGFLDTLTYILVIASLVQVVGLFIKKYSPSLYRSLGIYLPLITTNCAVLGVVSENTASNLDFLSSIANGIGTSLGFLIVITLFAAIRVRLESASTPKAFKGIPIALIVASIMAMAFMGLGGLGN